VSMMCSVDTISFSLFINASSSVDDRRRAQSGKIERICAKDNRPSFLSLSLSSARETSLLTLDRRHPHPHRRSSSRSWRRQGRSPKSPFIVRTNEPEREEVQLSGRHLLELSVDDVFRQGELADEGGTSDM
jgi:hypothetical protein